MTTSPVSSPCAAGSIIRLAGPLIYPLVIILSPVNVVNTPVEAVVAPIAASSIVPPLISGDVKVLFVSVCVSVN